MVHQLSANLRVRGKRSRPKIQLTLRPAKRAVRWRMYVVSDPTVAGSRFAGGALSRRKFLRVASGAAAVAAAGHNPLTLTTRAAASATSRGVRLFLASDVMTGRAIDQILPNPLPSAIAERGAKSARGYIELAERANGPIPPRVGFDYIWGDALAELEARAPARRIVNLETSVTTYSGRWPKEINYRMHPRNVGCLRAAKIDCCSVANNHLLDFSTAGLQETLATLGTAGIAHAGDSSAARRHAAAGFWLRLTD